MATKPTQTVKEQHRTTNQRQCLKKAAMKAAKMKVDHGTVTENKHDLECEKRCPIVEHLFYYIPINAAKN